MTGIDYTSNDDDGLTMIVDDNGKKTAFTYKQLSKDCCKILRIKCHRKKFQKEIVCKQKQSKKLCKENQKPSCSKIKSFIKRQSEQRKKEIDEKRRNEKEKKQKKRKNSGETKNYEKRKSNSEIDNRYISEISADELMGLVKAVKRAGKRRKKNPKCSKRPRKSMFR